MILSRYHGRLLVVAQPEHGVQTGVIASLWGNEEIHHRPRSEQCGFAARHHDDGWAVWEHRPTLDEDTCQPIQFYDVRPDEHLAAYRAGIVRAAQIDPWAGLLVSMHGAGLYNDRYGTYRLEEIGEQPLTPDERVLVNEFLADMAAFQRDLYAAATGHAPVRPPHELDEVLDDYLALQVWDRISLQYALRHATDGVIAPLSSDQDRRELVCRNRGHFTLGFDPYPFVEDGVDFPVTARIIEDRAYRDPEDFLATLAASTPETLECRAVRLEGRA